MTHYIPAMAKWSETAECIEVAAEALLDAARHAHTTGDALRLYHIAAGLRVKLDTVAVRALEQADALCGVEVTR